MTKESNPDKNSSKLSALREFQESEVDDRIVEQLVRFAKSGNNIEIEKLYHLDCSIEFAAAESYLVNEDRYHNSTALHNLRYPRRKALITKVLTELQNNNELSLSSIQNFPRITFDRVAGELIQQASTHLITLRKTHNQRKCYETTTNLGKALYLLNMLQGYVSEDKKDHYKTLIIQAASLKNSASLDHIRNAQVAIYRESPDNPGFTQPFDAAYETLVTTAYETKKEQRIIAKALETLAPYLSETNEKGAITYAVKMYAELGDEKSISEIINNKGRYSEEAVDICIAYFMNELSKENPTRFKANLAALNTIRKVQGNDSEPAIAAMVKVTVALLGRATSKDHDRVDRQLFPILEDILLSTAQAEGNLFNKVARKLPESILNRVASRALETQQKTIEELKTLQKKHDGYNAPEAYKESHPLLDKMNDNYLVLSRLKDYVADIRKFEIKAAETAREFLYSIENAIVSRDQVDRAMKEAGFERTAAAAASEATLSSNTRWTTAAEEADLTKIKKAAFNGADAFANWRKEHPAVPDGEINLVAIRLLNECFDIREGNKAPEVGRTFDDYFAALKTIATYVTPGRTKDSILCFSDSIEQEQKQQMKKLTPERPAFGEARVTRDPGQLTPEGAIVASSILDMVVTGKNQPDGTRVTGATIVSPAVSNKTEIAKG